MWIRQTGSLFGVEVGRAGAAGPEAAGTQELEGEDLWAQ